MVRAHASLQMDCLTSELYLRGNPGTEQKGGHRKLGVTITTILHFDFELTSCRTTRFYQAQEQKNFSALHGLRFIRTSMHPMHTDRVCFGYE